MAPGQTAVLNATVDGGVPAGPVTYSSSNTLVANVNATSGAVNAMAVGSATITATLPSSPAALTSTTNVTVISQTQFTSMNTDLILDVCPNVDEANFNAAQPVSANLSMVHEYHDCQKLIQGGNYAGVVGIFAHANVDDYQDPMDFKNGRLVAVIVNFAGKNGFIAYPSLDLQGGTNCVVLRYVPGFLRLRPKWQAGIISRGGYGDCSDNITWDSVPTLHRHALLVQSDKKPGFAPDGTNTMPPVARWDWDESAGLNYMGLKCDKNTWCEIGNQGGFSRSAALVRNGKPLIKGYYDEQYLARLDGSLSQLWGTIEPGADMATPDKIKRNNAWFEGAVLTFTAKTPAGNSDLSSYVELFGSMSSITETGNKRSSRLSLLMSDPDGTDQNFDFLTNIPGKHLKYRDHGSSRSNKTPIVRWRWLKKDETSWEWCPAAGCCELVDDGGN